MDKLALKIPPVPLVIIFAALAYGLDQLLPVQHLSQPLTSWLALTFIISGVILAVAGLWSFKRAKTTVNPLKPAQASHLVTSGIYRVTRNPMYLGFLLALIGFCCYLGNLLTLVMAPLFILYMNRFQIKPEEQILDKQFANFNAYCQQVRRWL